MKNFILQNWYRLITATAMLIFATATFIFVITNGVARAGDFNHQSSAPSPASVWMVVKNNKVYEVSWDKSTRSYKCNLVCEGY